MSSVLDEDTVREVLSVPLDAVPDLWAMAMEGTDQLGSQLARGVWSMAVAGNGAGIQQQITVLADRALGWAPWQADAVQGIASLPTAQLVSGVLFESFFTGDLAAMTWEALRDLAEQAIGAILRPFLDLLTAIPVVGWILDILISLVEGIVGIVKVAKESEDAKKAEGTIRPMVPSLDADTNLLEAVMQLAQTGDWTAMFVPKHDPVGQMIHERGFTCALIEPGDPPGSGPFASWRQILPRGDDAWGIAEGFGIGQGYPFFAPDRSGLGFIPGVGSMHQGLQWGGKRVIDVGDWFPLANSGALQCWSLVWGDGPSLWSVDATVVETAWARYISLFLEDVVSGKLCTKNSAAQRQVVRSAFVQRMGADPKWSDAKIVESAAPIVAAQALRKRQQAFAKRTSVAYTNQFEAPPGIRGQIQANQAELLTSYDVCLIDRFMVPDGLYRMRVEAAQESFGLACTAPGSFASAVKGPVPWDPSAPPIPDSSPAMARATFRVRPASKGPPARGSTPSRPSLSTSGPSSGAGVAILGIAAAMLAFAVATPSQRARARR